jgi:hypothetical protein
MQVTVSINVDLPTIADINQIEYLVHEAGQHAMRAATQKAVRAAEEQCKTCLHCASKTLHSAGTDRQLL